MTLNPGIQPGAEVQNDKKVESGGLAPAARAMLEGVFYNPAHVEFMEKYRQAIIDVIQERGTEVDKKLALKAIDQQLAKVDQLFGDSAGYANSYYSRLRAQVVEAETLAN